MLDPRVHVRRRTGVGPPGGVDHTVGFIRRHQVQEAVVGRWDVRSAASNNVPDPIDAEVASDSIDEFLAISPAPWSERDEGERRPIFSWRITTASLDAPDVVGNASLARHLVEWADRTTPVMPISPFLANLGVGPHSTALRQPGAPRPTQLLASSLCVTGWSHLAGALPSSRAALLRRPRSRPVAFQVLNVSLMGGRRLPAGRRRRRGWPG
jgi:hypothetical protein